MFDCNDNRVHIIRNSLRITGPGRLIYQIVEKMNDIETHVSGDQDHFLLCVRTPENLMRKTNQKMHF